MEKARWGVFFVFGGEDEETGGRRMGNPFVGDRVLSGRTHCTDGARVLMFFLGALRRGGKERRGRWALPRPGRGVTPLHPAWMGSAKKERCG